MDSTMEGRHLFQSSSEKAAKPQDWRRYVLRAGLLAGAIVFALYEYSLRYPSHHQEELPVTEQRHEGLEFMDQVHQAREEVAPDFTLSDVKKEFLDKYAENARSLLCSGCILAADRIGDELGARNASGQPDPPALLAVTKEAIIEACDGLPSPLIVVEGGKKGSLHFEEPHDSALEHLTGVELRRSEVARRSAHRLCRVLLADAKLAMLDVMMRHKVPHARRHSSGEALNDNWERWLCARRARLCKRSEVVDDDEDDHEGEL
ncbi:unnamed protein product [Polarella glacialis]|uniref:Uncharacterized protein n=1 Tax=Polarella glacialis TaxID=89957 RepID=A0A813JRX7_POLGL|nr:unnamed protein product [Polarella glacialis]CAE8684214.1 unnamed protein product [Polarella glacialis]